MVWDGILRLFVVVVVVVFGRKMGKKKAKFESEF
jgi:hypothetical protein